MDPTRRALPAYADLPVIDGAPPGSAWGVWGDDDRLGALNLLTPERVAAGMAVVREHRVISLSLPLNVPGPPLFNRRRHEHVVTDVTVGHDEYLSSWFPQASSQWDGFRHVRFPEYGFFGGLADEDHGMEHWAQHGIVGRGVLVDVGQWRSAQGRPLDFTTADPISVADVRSALEAQGTEVETGDVLHLRTGWTSWYRSLSGDERAALAEGGVYSFFAPGLEPGRDTAAFFWDLHIAALVADNPAVERWPRGWPLSEAAAREAFADPESCESVSLHFSMLPLLGIPLGELWDLDELAAACSEDGRYEFMLAASPLALPGGVGSTANALAIR